MTECPRVLTTGGRGGGHRAWPQEATRCAGLAQFHSRRSSHPRPLKACCAPCQRDRAGTGTLLLCVIILLAQTETSWALSQPAKSGVFLAGSHRAVKQSPFISGRPKAALALLNTGLCEYDELCAGCEAFKCAPHPVTRCAAGAGAGPAAQARSAAGVVGRARAALGLTAGRRAGLRQGELAPGAPGGAAGCRAGALWRAGACLHFLVASSRLHDKFCTGITVCLLPI